MDQRMLKQLQQMQKKIARLEQETQPRRNEHTARDTFVANRFKYRIPFETGYTENKEGGREKQLLPLGAGDDAVAEALS